MKNVNRENVRAALSRGRAFEGDNKAANPYYEIASVIIVGGLLHDDASLTDNDFLSLPRFINACVSLGVQFADGLKVQVCNLEYGDDFIRDTPHADLLILSWVNHGLDDANDDKIGGESPLLYKGHTWQTAIEESSTPFVGMVTDNFSCVGRRDIPESYSLVNYSSQRTVYDYPLFRRNMP